MSFNIILEEIMSDQDLVIAFAGGIVEAEFVKSLLESADIPCFLKDENIGTIAPFVEPAGLAAVKVVIRASDLEKARPIIEEFQQDQDASGDAAG
jgi:hypothetical protein